MTWRRSLPRPSERRIAVRVTPDALRQIRAGTPWLYDGSITSAGEGEPGDLAVVFDDRRKFAAIGLWDPSSPIRVKVLHAGEPTTIDRGWFRGALTTSLDRRAELANDAGTTGYRCVHGENDGLPGLVVDRYDATLVVKLYSPIWFAHLDVVCDALAELVSPVRIVVRLARSVAKGETFGIGDGDTLQGEPPYGPVLFLERGLTLEADVVRGQKTGHFLDQRDNRTLVRGLAAGCEVLDVFSSTGGFSVAAAAGGARSVHMVDQAAPAIEVARRNLDHNRHLAGVRSCAVRATADDAFDVLRRLRRSGAGAQYDLIVLDPPSFAGSRAQVERALNAYRTLTRLALPLLRPGGVLVQASCSSRVGADEFFDAIHDGARSVGRRLHEIRRTGHPVDHPIGFPHGAYLKALFAHVD